MTDTPNGKPNIFPTLRYDDAPAAMGWLARAFGFEQHSVMPNEDGTIAHAELRLGAGIVMLGSARPDVPASGSAGADRHGIYVALPETDSHYERAKAAGAEITRPLEDTDYGSREYTARDLEGNVWTFGTYLP
jgi:uncharacterized glyoxalase superfamily protein PhnB